MLKLSLTDFTDRIATPATGDEDSPTAHRGGEAARLLELDPIKQKESICMECRRVHPRSTTLILGSAFGTSQ